MEHMVERIQHRVSIFNHYYMSNLVLQLCATNIETVDLQLHLASKKMVSKRLGRITIAAKLA